MTKLILFYKDQLVLTTDDDFIELNKLVDYSKQLADYFICLKESNQLVNLSNNYYTANISQEIFCHFSELSNFFIIKSIRSLLLNTNFAIEYNKIKMITIAKQLAHWHDDHQYCGRCGNKTSDLITHNTEEYAKECEACDLVSYPRISPCILAAVMKYCDNTKKILLGRSYHFPAKTYSILAGFVNVGESAEETVKREVYEETKIEVNNIRYYGSQPWPFPHSLMLAYIADYASGEIVVDTNELEDAQWYDLNTLLIQDKINLPAKGSLSRMLLDYLISNDSG